MKNIFQKKKHLAQRYMSSKGFTLIELIVVMAIIGILVLLATPRFLGRTADALATRIKNDISVAETKVDEYLIAHDDLDEWNNTYEMAHLNGLREEGTLHNRKGLIDTTDTDAVKSGSYSEIPTSFIDASVKSQLDGNFYANDEGDVYYHAPADAEEGTTISDFAIPDYYELATDDDFVYIEVPYAPDGKGYYAYVGVADYVIIPDVIQGKTITDTFSMFGVFKHADYNDGLYSASKAKGVASNNPNITDMESMFDQNLGTSIELNYLNTSYVTDMNDMFKGAYLETISFGDTFDTSNVTDMSGMFDATSADALDLSGFNTASVTNMNYMFSNSYATMIDVSNFDTSNVTSMNSMFNSSRALELDLSSFDTSNVLEMSGMFQRVKATVGYARTTEDADRFNDVLITGILDSLTFSVK